jgi:hypothetical protein
LGKHKEQVIEYGRIEGYIMSHSQATFTHGICPDCNEELYGDLLAKRSKKQY